MLSLCVEALVMQFCVIICGVARC